MRAYNLSIFLFVKYSFLMVSNQQKSWRVGLQLYASVSALIIIFTLIAICSIVSYTIDGCRIHAVVQLLSQFVSHEYSHEWYKLNHMFVGINDASQFIIRIGPIIYYMLLTHLACRIIYH